MLEFFFVRLHSLIAAQQAVVLDLPDLGERAALRVHVPLAQGVDAGWLQLELVALSSGIEPSAWRTALVEATAMARSLIFVDAPEACELIRHGRDGLLVPVCIAHALQLLVRQPSFMRELGKRAQRKVVALYQLAEELDRTLETYRRLLPLERGDHT